MGGFVIWGENPDDAAAGAKRSVGGQPESNPFAMHAVAVDADGGGGGEEGELVPQLVPRKALPPLHCSLDPIMFAAPYNNNHQRT